jgi:hypothetical protein
LACRPVLAGHGVTVIDVELTMNSVKASRAVAAVIALTQIVTCPSVETRLLFAAGDLLLAVFSTEPDGALAGVRRQPVHADPAVETGVVSAVVGVRLTGVALVALQTGACERARAGVCAGPAVLAGGVLAAVGLCLAEVAAEALRAAARRRAVFISALSAVQTRIRLAIVDGLAADAVTLEPLITGTQIGSCLVRAGRVSVTWRRLRRALVDVCTGAPRGGTLPSRLDRAFRPTSIFRGRVPVVTRLAVIELTIAACGVRIPHALSCVGVARQTFFTDPIHEVELAQIGVTHIARNPGLFLTSLVASVAYEAEPVADRVVAGPAVQVAGTLLTRDAALAVRVRYAARWGGCIRFDLGAHGDIIASNEKE